eukprot:403339456
MQTDKNLAIEMIEEYKIFENDNTKIQSNGYLINYFKDDMIDLIITQLEFLFREKKVEKCLQYATIWLKRYKKLKGDSNENTLKLYGLVGELMLIQNHSHDEIEKPMIYLQKFSKISLDSYLRTLQILEENDMKHYIMNFMPPFFNLKGMQPNLFKFVVCCTFRKEQYDPRQVREVGFQQLFQNPEEDKKLIYRICKSENVFMLFVRYLSIFEINVNGELVFSQTKFQYPHLKGIDMKLQMLNEKIKEHQLIIK